MKKILLAGLIMFALPIASFAREYDNYADCTADNGTKFCDGYFAGKNKNTGANTSAPAASVAATPAKAEPVKKPDSYFFVGANLGLGTASYVNENDSKYMPSGFLKGGFEFGFKFKVVDDYGLGLTIAPDFYFPAEIAAQYSVPGTTATIQYNIMSMYLDNYFNTSSDEAFVIGFGAAAVDWTMRMTYNGHTTQTNSPTSYDAVSYTHLDVYKRQGNRCLNYFSHWY